jgi:hypothetical protein
VPKYRPERLQRPPGTVLRRGQHPQPAPLADTNPVLAESLREQFVAGLVAAWPEGELTTKEEVRVGLGLGTGDTDGRCVLYIEFGGATDGIEWDGSASEAQEIVDGAVERFPEELEADRPVDEGEGWRAYRS